MSSPPASFAIVISIALGPRFIALLRRYRIGQNIREEGPEGHKTKQGTPTMGGIMIVVGTVIPYLILSDYGRRSLAVLGAMLGCAAIGLLDDWRSVIRKRSLGLRGRYKLLRPAAGLDPALRRRHRLRASRPRSSCRSWTCTSTSGRSGTCSCS